MSEAHKYDDSYALTKIKEGDEYFFNLVYEKYRNKLFIYLYKITKSREVAEETVIDVFLKLWHGREVVTEIENLERFLFKVAYHKAVDFLRSAKRDPVILREIWEVIQKSSDEKADKQLLQDNIEAAVRTGAEQLTPQRQKVFYLRYNEGLSYEEIASRLNLSLNTVRNHLAASVQFIREFLQKDHLLFLVIGLLLEKNQ